MIVSEKLLPAVPSAKTVSCWIDPAGRFYPINYKDITHHSLAEKVLGPGADPIDLEKRGWLHFSCIDLANIFQPTITQPQLDTLYDWYTAFKEAGRKAESKGILEIWRFYLNE